MKKKFSARIFGYIIFCLTIMTIAKIGYADDYRTRIASIDTATIAKQANPSLVDLLPTKEDMFNGTVKNITVSNLQGFPNLKRYAVQFENIEP
jgi:hypothetical protein